MEKGPDNIERRGDGFDIGESVEGEVIEPGGDEVVSIEQFVQNPSQFIESLKMTGKQAQNVNTGIFVGTVGVVYHFLAPKVGERLAGVAAGGIGGWLNSKLFGSRGQR